MQMYIGLDVHSKQTVYVAQEADGKLMGQGQVPTTPEGLRQVVETLQAPPLSFCGLETGTQATWVSRQLTALGMKPVVIDAREVRLKARRAKQKSDRRDAFEICDGLRRDIYTTIIFVPEEPLEKLRLILSRRRHFVRMRTQQVNAAKFLLRSRGLKDLARSLTTGRAWERLQSHPDAKSLCDYLAMHGQMWKEAGQRIQTLEKELEDALAPFAKTAELLQTVPGVGPVTSATFIAALGTPERFPDSAHVVSYLGLAVSTYDSGERERHGHITKSGNSDARGVLCEAAHHAAKPTHPLNPYFTRLCAKRGYKPAVIAVAQRLARILFQIWRRGQPFDLAKLNVMPSNKVRSKRIYYELKNPPKAA